MVVGAVGTTYGEYAYWRGWVRATFGAGALLLLVVYAAGGGLGLLLFHILNGSPTSATAAAADGIAGQALLRTRLNRLHVDESDAASILGSIHEWLIGWMNTRAKRTVERRVRGLGDDQLIAQTWDLYWTHIDPQEADKAKLLPLHTGLRDATVVLRDQPVDAAESRGRLRGFCSETVARHHLEPSDITDV